MLRKLVIFGICAGTSASVPIIYQSGPDGFVAYLSSRAEGEAASLTHAVNLEIADGASAPPRPASTAGRRVSLEADQRGHFLGEFRLNGRRLEAMVDTGATAVALNLTTARRIGIPVGRVDLTRTVRTANGEARATVVTIDRLEIGRISIDDVEAIVLEDSSLATTLIGMSFLSRLKTFQVNGAEMVMVQ